MAEPKTPQDQVLTQKSTEPAAVAPVKIDPATAAEQEKATKAALEVAKAFKSENALKGNTKHIQTELYRATYNIPKDVPAELLRSGVIADALAASTRVKLLVDFESSVSQVTSSIRENINQLAKVKQTAQFRENFQQQLSVLESEVKQELDVRKKLKNSVEDAITKQNKMLPELFTLFSESKLSKEEMLKRLEEFKVNQQKIQAEISKLGANEKEIQGKLKLLGEDAKQVVEATLGKAQTGNVSAPE